MGRGHHHPRPADRRLLGDGIWLRRQPDFVPGAFQSRVNRLNARVAELAAGQYADGRRPHGPSRLRRSPGLLRLPADRQPHLPYRSPLVRPPTLNRPHRPSDRVACPAPSRACRTSRPLRPRLRPQRHRLRRRRQPPRLPRPSDRVACPAPSRACRTSRPLQPRLRPQRRGLRRRRQPPRPRGPAPGALRPLTTPGPTSNPHGLAPQRLRVTGPDPTSECSTRRTHDGRLPLPRTVSSATEERVGCNPRLSPTSEIGRFSIRCSRRTATFSAPVKSILAVGMRTPRVRHGQQLTPTRRCSVSV